MTTTITADCIYIWMTNDDDLYAMCCQVARQNDGDGQCRAVADAIREHVENNALDGFALGSASYREIAAAIIKGMRRDCA